MDLNNSTYRGKLKFFSNKKSDFFTSLIIQTALPVDYLLILYDFFEMWTDFYNTQNFSLQSEVQVSFIYFFSFIIFHGLLI